jgi:glycosyltransferase involved in cell wall biosynthesis
MEIINVLWIVDHLGYQGIMHGAGKYYLNTVPYFDKNKFKITLCVIRKKDHLSSLFENAEISIRHLGRGKYDPLTLFEISKIIKSEKINLIHTHGYGSDNFGRIVGKLLDIPTIIHAHDDNSNYFWHQRIADYFLIPFNKKAIAVSETVKISCVEKRKINEKNIRVFHNALQLEKFVNLSEIEIKEEKNRYKIKTGSKIVGAVGRLRKEKGINFLIEAIPQILKSFPEVTFFIAGDGPLKNELENRVKQLGIEQNVIFAGFCNNIPAVLSIVDIFVSPSLTEGSPLGILEAMAMHKPIVATNVGGVKEILKDNETGLLVPSENPNQIAKKVIELLQNEDKLLFLSNNAGIEIKNYDINNYIKKLENYYLEVIKT